MKFLKPNEKFVPTIKSLVKDSMLLDCGCGEGHITELLSNSGITTIGSELQFFEEHEKIKSIVHIDAIKLLAKKVVPLIIRPCSGEWYFNIIDKALTQFDSYAILVQKPANYKRDVVKLRKKYEVKLIKKFVGEEKESIYLITKKDKTMEYPETDEEITFCLVQTPYWTYWLEDCDGYFKNMVGGRIPKTSAGSKVLETVRTKNDFESLDWTKTTMVDNSHDSGWLSPTGDFYGCEYMQHDTVARYYLKQKPDDLMKMGWCHIYSKNEWVKYGTATPQQRFFLDNNGYSQEEGCRSEQLYFSEGEDQL